MKAGSFGAAYRSFAFLNLRRYRVGYIWSSVVLLAIAIGVDVALANIPLVGGSHPADARDVLYGGFVLTWLLCTLLTNSNTVFQAGATDVFVQNTAPTYPRTRRSLPIDNKTLFLAPILWGATPSLSVWALFAIGVIVPFGLAVPIFLPPLFVLACLCAFHAFTWINMDSNSAGGRHILLILAYFVALGYGMLHHVEEPMLDLLSMALLAWSLVRGFQAMAGARVAVPTLPAQVQAAESQPRSGLRLRLPSPDKCQTPDQSSAWMLERQNASPGCLVAGLIVVAIIYGRLAFVSNAIGPRLGVGDIRVGDGTLFTLALLFGLLILAAAAGSGAYSNLLLPAAKGSPPVLKQMYSTRPISSAQLSLSLMRQAMQVLRYAGSAVGIGILIWLFMPAQDGTKAGPVGALLLGRATLPGVTLLVISLVLLACTAWALMLSTPLQYPGKGNISAVLRQLPLSTMMTPLFVGAFIPAFTGKRAPDVSWEDFNRNLLVFLPAIGVWLLVRTILVVVGISIVRRKRLLKDRTLFLGAGSWIAVLMAFAGAIYFLQDGLPFGVIALYVAFLLPLNRLFWPVLTIDAARHV